VVGTTPHLGSGVDAAKNAFDATHCTFGTFSLTALVPILQAPGATNPLSYSPPAPIADFVGIRVTFCAIFRGAGYPAERGGALAKASAIAAKAGFGRRSASNGSGLEGKPSCRHRVLLVSLRTIQL
jgi:hypothetical protein